VTARISQAIFPSIGTIRIWLVKRYLVLMEEQFVPPLEQYTLLEMLELSYW
jgi:hypothetical protein